MKKILLILLSLLVHNVVNASLSLSLSEAIRLAQEHSLDAQVARFTFLGSYWTYRSYRAELLPSASLSGSLLNYDRSITSVRNYEDGRINYVENNSLTNSLTLSVSQNIAQAARCRCSRTFTGWTSSPTMNAPTTRSRCALPMTNQYVPTTHSNGVVNRNR